MSRLIPALVLIILTALPAQGQRRSEPPFVRVQAGVVGWYGGQLALQVWPVNFGFTARVMRGFSPSFLEADALVHIGPPQINLYGGGGMRRSGPKEDDKIGRIWVAGVELNTASGLHPAGWGLWVDYHRPLGKESDATRGFTVGLNFSAALGF